MPIAQGQDGQEPRLLPRPSDCLHEVTRLILKQDLAPVPEQACVAHRRTPFLNLPTSLPNLLKRRALPTEALDGSHDHYVLDRPVLLHPPSLGTTDRRPDDPNLDPVVEG